jgi:putative SOS response-associated peptidase YedK
MCTNYHVTRAEVEYFVDQAGLDLDLDLPDWKPDIWPDYAAPAVLPAGADAAAELGVYGFWPKFLQPERHDERGRKLQPYATVNGRGEEVGTKRLYAAAWRAGQRCLVPAGYVVEPCWETGKNVWHRIGLADGHPFAVAGIWKRYDTPGGPVLGISMLTVNADGHAVMRRMHRPNDEKRSVVILRPADYDEWLHTSNVDAARAMLQLYPAAELVAEPLLSRPGA